MAAKKAEMVIAEAEAKAEAKAALSLSRIQDTMAMGITPLMYPELVNGGMTYVAYVTKAEAKKITSWSLAYLNKLINPTRDDNDAIIESPQVIGLRKAGLGWQISLDSLLDFKATSGRKEGKQSLLNSALVAFLTEKKLLADWEKIESAITSDWEKSRSKK